MTSAMILCAGFGTRLNELTKDTPKPMLEVGGKPILEHTINNLKKAGVKDIIINLHYLHEKITDYFADGSKLGVKITYSYEEHPLGTAGAVKNVESLLCNEDHFLVIYGDIFTNLDFKEFIDFHASKADAVGSIIVHERDKSNSIVEMDENNRIIKFIERPDEAELLKKKQNWVNSSIYCFNKSIFDYIPPEKSDFPKDIFSILVNEKKLYAFPLKGYRCAVDSQERYFMLKSNYKDGAINSNS